MSPALSRMNLVESVDSAMMDEDDNGHQRWMVRLKPGWAFADAATCPEADPEGRNAQHSRGGTVREIQKLIKGAMPCRCGLCVVALSKIAGEGKDG